ncbi:MAG: DUF2163 domain-containing protein [Erythrobacter sp.]|uniref:DUF2163 domain-containing protein n=1 Tax=Erythrobacter sp. TaxID=1042 RepID=UPI002601DC31|nr:DUF2163 domain-containing protein [Erythrobacter sp.]MDJ0979504.1 DUF2163 domain-containing protein [Erythrobacter sp.]
MTVFFDRELDTVATFWRVYRRDGVALGFTSHDRDLVFSGIRHRAAPGMVPAAIRLSSAIKDDSSEVEGALSHDSIREADLSGGLFDQSGIIIGAVNWETLENEIFYSGRIGAIDDDRHGFSAQLRSAKHILDHDLVPRTSPTCRANFCGPGCGLSAPRFTTRRALATVDLEGNRIGVDQPASTEFIDGQVRFLAGPQTGLVFGIIDADGTWLTLDRPLLRSPDIGTPVELREGCDHTLATCASRFDNARNFRGEPFLPGNDLLSRYGTSNG